MKAQKWFSVILSIVVVFSLLLPMAVAEEETIKIGGLAPLTGPYAVYGEAVKNGADLYVSLLNQNGGIDGKMVEILWEDHAANDAQAQNIYYQYVDEEMLISLAKNFGLTVEKITKTEDTLGRSQVWLNVILHK
jgi:ABC-type branched-subunit amino acid transport system substrate-binding protein